LAAESEHEVTLALQAGQFVYGVVDQLDVNVVVAITSDDGPVGRFNASSRQEERFTFESEDAGTFTIRLVSFEDGGGEYTITIHRIEDIADDPEDRVDQLMIAYDDDETPGAIVGVVEDGRLVFEKAYGMANLTWDVPFDE
jgi:CubicO group peptidase (beta-lactamase class C family)